MPDTRKRMARKQNVRRRLTESDADIQRDKAIAEQDTNYTIPEGGYDYPLPEDSWPGAENGGPVNDWPKSNTPVGQKARDARATEQRKYKDITNADRRTRYDEGRRRTRDRNILINRRGHKDPGDNRYPDPRQTGDLDLNKLDTKAQQLDRLDVGKNKQVADEKLKNAAKKRLQRAGRR